MIFINTDPRKFAEKENFDFKESIDCIWGCDKVMCPRVVRTKDSIGLYYKCESCDAWTVTLRPYTKDAKAFWETII